MGQPKPQPPSVTSLVPGRRYFFKNHRSGLPEACLDRHDENGVIAGACDFHGGDCWDVKHAPHDALAFTNDRPGMTPGFCLDHGPDEHNVGAYSCDTHGGDYWH